MGSCNFMYMCTYSKSLCDNNKMEIYLKHSSKAKKLNGAINSNN